MKIELYGYFQLLTTFNDLFKDFLYDMRSTTNRFSELNFLFYFYGISKNKSIRSASNTGIARSIAKMITPIRFLQPEIIRDIINQFLFI